MSFLLFFRTVARKVHRASTAPLAILQARTYRSFTFNRQETFLVSLFRVQFELRYFDR